MANARGKKVDKTYLSVDNAEERGFIHRDYIAHCLRWSHVLKRLNEKKNYQTARLLDIGCGRELPLAKSLYSSRFIVKKYYGVDVGPIEDAALSTFDSGKFPLKVWDDTDVMELDASDFDDKPINYATMFEVAEHVEPLHLIRILKHVRSLMAPNGTFFVSTPCYNWKDCAANHVNEMTYDAFGAMLEGTGWSIQKVFGTFASIADYQHLLRPEQKLQFDLLREYYDSNFLSIIFAPLFPGHSRNCLWELRPSAKIHPRRFPKIQDCKTPWGSSANWEDMAKGLL